MEIGLLLGSVAIKTAEACCALDWIVPRSGDFSLMVHVVRSAQNQRVPMALLLYLAIVP